MNNVVNDDYVDKVLSTLFVKWFLDDVFALLCGLFLYELVSWLKRFKLMNVVCYYLLCRPG